MSDMTGGLNSFIAFCSSVPGANCIFAQPNINLCHWLLVSHLSEKERVRQGEGRLFKVIVNAKLKILS